MKIRTVSASPEPASHERSEEWRHGAHGQSPDGETQVQPARPRGGAAAGAISLAIISPNGPALRATPRADPVVALRGSFGNTSSAKR